MSGLFPFPDRCTSLLVDVMDNFQDSKMHSELGDVGYLAPHMSLDGMTMMQDSNFMAATSGRHESIDTSMMTAFDESDALNVRRSISYGSSSTQSQSPPLHSQFPGLDIAQLQKFTNPFTNSLEQISPVTASSSSRRDSDDESQRAEVRGHLLRVKLSLLTPR